jgi:predicted nucleotidyltransferase
VDLHPDFRDLLAELVLAGAEFAIIGGYAVGHHAKPRATKDLDLLVAGSTENLAKVADALARFGAPALVVESARRLAPTEIVYLGVPPVRVDILRQADGIDVETAIARADAVTVDDLPLRVLSLDDLIANKRAAGRPQDLADVQLLERVKARRQPSG